MKIFLTNIFHAAAMLFSKVAAATKGTIAVILTLTGLIITELQKADVIDIIGIISPEIKAAIPNIEAILAKAILLLTAVNGIEQIAQQPGQSDQDFLTAIFSELVTTMKGMNFFSIHAFWVKVASLMLGLLDGNTQTESDYDTAIQVAIKNSKIPVTEQDKK